MKPRIEKLAEKTLIGKSLQMSVANNSTFELWNEFIKSKHLIRKAVGTDLYSIQVYKELSYFDKFNPNTEFTKWAAIEVESLNKIPNGFLPFVINKGLYAVFLHKGAASEFYKTFQYILTEWLPQSQYQLDHRPHFELLGEKYKNNDPTSEEEIWIPIQKRT